MHLAAWGKRRISVIASGRNIGVNKPARPISSTTKIRDKVSQTRRRVCLQQPRPACQPRPGRNAPNEVPDSSVVPRIVIVTAIIRRNSTGGRATGPILQIHDRHGPRRGPDTLSTISAGRNAPHPPSNDAPLRIMRRRNNQRRNCHPSAYRQPDLRPTLQRRQHIRTHPAGENHRAVSPNSGVASPNPAGFRRRLIRQHRLQPTTNPQRESPLTPGTTATKAVLANRPMHERSRQERTTRRLCQRRASTSEMTPRSRPVPEYCDATTRTAPTHHAYVNPPEIIEPVAIVRYPSQLLTSRPSPRPRPLKPCRICRNHFLLSVDDRRE